MEGSDSDGHGGSTPPQQVFNAFDPQGAPSTATPDGAGAGAGGGPGVPAGTPVSVTRVGSPTNGQLLGWYTYAGWSGGAVFVNREKFVEGMAFQKDGDGLACKRALRPTRGEQSPTITHVGDIFRGLQRGELEGLTPPKNFRTVSFLDKNIVPFGTRSAVGRRRGAVDWDHTKLDVSSDAAIFDLITANEYKASCWVSVKCSFAEGYKCPGQFLLMFSWADVRDETAEDIPVVIRPTKFSQWQEGAVPGFCPGCVHPQGVNDPDGGRASRQRELPQINLNVSLAHTVAEGLVVPEHMPITATLPNSSQLGARRTRKKQRMWGELESSDWEELRDMYAAEYIPEEPYNEGKADNPRTLKSRLVPFAAGDVTTFMCTSDLDIRTLVRIIGKLGSAFTAGIDLSGGLMEDHETKRAYLMVALNVYGGPEGDGRRPPAAGGGGATTSRAQGGGSFTPFWWFSPTFNSYTICMFLLKTLALIKEVTGSECPSMASLMCDHDRAQLKAICQILHTKTIGDYFSALQDALLTKSSLQGLWPIILHDNFHSNRKTKLWNKKHMSGPSNKHLRMLLITISRAYNMLGHPRLYPFVAEDGFEDDDPLPEPDTAQMRDTPQAKARLARLTSLGLMLQQFFAYVLLTKHLPFTDSFIVFEDKHKPLDLTQAHDHPKQFPQSGTWPSEVAVPEEVEVECDPKGGLTEEEKVREDGEEELGAQASEEEEEEEKMMKALQFCVELRVGHRGSGDDGKTKTRVTVRAGELRLKSRGDITQQNAVSWSAWITDEEVERLLAQGVSANQWPTSANLWPTQSAFQSEHCAWYHATHMAPHMLAASYCTGRTVHTAGSSGQEEPFNKVKQHRINIFKNARVLSLECGVRLMCGNLVGTERLDILGFQRYNLLTFLNAEGVLIQRSAEALPPVEVVGVDKDNIAWGRQLVATQLSERDPAGHILISELKRVRDVYWPKAGLKQRGGFNNIKNISRFSIPTAVQCLPSAERAVGVGGQPRFPLLSDKTLTALMKGEWWFWLSTKGWSTQGPEEKGRAAQRKEETVPTPGLDECFEVPKGVVLNEEQKRLCTLLLSKWAEEAKAIHDGWSAYTFTTKGDLSLKTPTALPTRSAAAGGNAAGPSSSSAHAM